jgi:hypothetical protein
MEALYRTEIRDHLQVVQGHGFFFWVRNPYGSERHIYKLVVDFVFRMPNK